MEDLNSIGNNKKNSKGTKIIRNVIIILLVLIVILGGIFAYLYFCTDIFKTSKQLFFKYASQIVASENGFIDNNVTNYYEKQTNTPFENNGQISINVEDNSSTASSSGQVLDILNGFNIEFSGATDKTNNKAEQNININYAEDISWPIIYRHDGDTYGLQTDDVSQKFVAVENNNLKQFMENLGVTDTSNIPDRIEKPQAFENLIYTEEEKETVKQKYMTVLNEQLQDEQFTKQKSEDGTYSYTLTIQNEQIKNLIIALLTELKNDDITLGKINSVVTEYDLATIKPEDIDSIISNLQDSVVEEGEYIITITQKNSALNSITVENGVQKLAIQKQNQNGNLVYSLGIENLDEGESQMNLNFNITLSGLNEMQNVQEKYEYVVESFENSESIAKITFSFENTSNFVDSVDIEGLSDDNAMILNDYEPEQLQTFMGMLIQRISDINADYMEQLEIGAGESTNGSSDNISGTQNDTQENNNLNEMEIQAFNNVFNTYEGVQKGTAVKSLINQTAYQNSNADIENGDPVVEIQYGEIENNDDQLAYGSAGEDYIISNNEYEISFEYDEEGRVNKVIISGEFQTE